MAAAKIAYRRELGTFAVQQAQLQGQAAAAKANQHVDLLRVLNNRVYIALDVDISIGIAAYATLLQSNIITILDRGFLLITFTASCVHITNAATIFFQILVDGVVKKGSYATFAAVSSGLNVSMVLMVPVRKGPHNIKLQWKTDNVTARILAKTVVEEHCHLLVQEAL